MNSLNLAHTQYVIYVYIYIFLSVHVCIYAYRIFEKHYVALHKLKMSNIQRYIQTGY